MAIVCGIDFTAPSLRAASTAAWMAARRKKPFHLVHVQREAGGHETEVRLRREADRLAAEAEITVTPRVLTGKVDAELVRYAEEVGAKLVVIGALGNRSPEAFQLGGNAERIAQAATVPVLVLRRHEAFDEWLGGRRPLEVFVAFDRTGVAPQTLALVKELRCMRPCNVTVLHLYWAAEEFYRLGMGTRRDSVDRDPEVERVLERELRAAVEGLPGEGEVNLRLETAVGRASDQIIDSSVLARADVVVVGMHRRNLVERLWSGSTSRAVLRRAPSSVGSVLEGEQPQQQAPEGSPRIASVLVATDLSAVGNDAVPWACALLPRGGIVHLMHVVELEARLSAAPPRDVFEGPWSAEEQAALQSAEEQLGALVPADAQARGVSVRPIAIGGAASATAILQAAERLGVDAIVLGTRGRTGVARAVLGSVAQEVALQSPRPVLLVRGQKGQGG